MKIDDTFAQIISRIIEMHKAGLMSEMLSVKTIVAAHEAVIANNEEQLGLLLSEALVEVWNEDNGLH